MWCTFKMEMVMLFNLCISKQTERSSLGSSCYSYIYVKDKPMIVIIDGAVLLLSATYFHPFLQ